MLAFCFVLLCLSSRRASDICSAHHPPLIVRVCACWECVVFLGEACGAFHHELEFSLSINQREQNSIVCVCVCVCV